MCAVERGQRDVAEVFDLFGDDIFRREDGHHFSTRRKLADQPTSLADQTQTVFPAHDAGNTGGGVLTNAMAKHHIGLESPALEQVNQSHLDCKDRRLGPMRVVDSAFVFEQYFGQ